MQDETIKNLVDEAKKLPQDQWTTFLVDQTNNDLDLIEKATVLLEKFKTNTSNDKNLANLDLGPGDMIGPYLILQELGSGGMGIVFLVEQKKPVHRRLALKVIRLGMDTKDVLARFELERQALALMSHPNVAAVIDAGVTSNGRPYFLMEYVPGTTITKYANTNHLSIKDRVKLVIQACKGVLHAHQKGILHRDIKPGNIIVTEKEGKPLVKIIDFGVAKSTQQKLSENTIYTQLGAFIGTPNYISPEQAGATGLDVDTRTDLYSLGIILYEMTVGELPFDSNTFHNKNLLEIQQIIKDKLPPSPYERLKSIGSINYFSSQCNTSSSEIHRILKGDLSSIIMRAIEKNRNERYASVSAFEEDLNRYLQGLPVEAQPHTTFYKIKRFVGSHKLLVGSISSIVLALAIGLGSALVSLRHAQRESAHAAAVSSLINGILLNANPWNKNYRDEITLQQVITELEKKLDDKKLLEGNEFNKARELGMENSLLWTLREHIGDLHKSVGDYEAADNNYRIAIALHKKAKNIDNLKLHELDLKRSGVLSEIGQIEIAEDLFDKSMATLKNPDSLKQAGIFLSANNVYKNKGEIDKSLKFEQQQLEIAEQFYGKESKQYISQLIGFSSSLLGTSQPENLKKALKFSHLAQRLAHELMPPDKDLEADARKTTITLLTSIPLLDKAVLEVKDFAQWSKKEFGETHIRTLDIELIRAYVFLWTGKPESILDITNKIEPMLSKSVKHDHYLMQKLNDLKGSALALLYRFSEALPIEEQGLAIAMSKNKIPSIAYYSNKVSTNAYYLGNLSKAEKTIKVAIENDTAKKGWNISAYYSHLAQILLAKNYPDKALAAAEQSLKAEKRNANAYLIKGLIANQQKEAEQAIEYLQKTVDIYASTFGEEQEDYSVHLADLALMQALNDKTQDAIETLKRIQPQNLNAINAAIIELSKLAVKAKNKQKINKKQAQKYYQTINQVMTENTLQNKYAKFALNMAKGL